MNRTHYLDDTTDPPPPPPWWHGPIVTLGFIVVLIAAVHFLTSCTCTLDGESVARAIIIYQSGK